MNILIAGAHGTTVKQIIEELSKNRQMNVYGMIRKEEQAQTIKELGGHPILADLEGNVDKAVDNMEAIIFAAGSGPKTGPDKTTAVDKNGAIKLVDAAKKKGIERFVMLSSVGSDNPEQAQEEMRHYLGAKHDADEHLKASGLTYTIVRPVSMTNEQAIGKIFADKKVDHTNKSIPRADVAAVLAQSVTEEKTFNKTFEIFSGTLPIKEALNNM
ncbi:MULTISPECIES: SDR family oxidoreductase [Peribacillus]|uniref:SDR family oxidoreductase n=1 Tax=Peribacillus castrilensis TaxID=2897690 RepID=A0AAW9NB61_9BACI|nr:SDR family oxidoreductase [Peribacillus frigoritolerans]MEC0271972.1 SDR family oxidoreductase [Peribacillus castrilensis]MEC0296815.1 SDR family oxidoreductase [Peribacillus castrilensis]TFH61607.1 SDR family oxidoreductase [Peribacillus frigoritolerans]